MVNELLDNLEELIDKYIKSGLTLCAYLESQNLTVIYNNMLQVIKRRVKLKTKERFDGLMAKINIQEKRVHRKVVKCLIKDKLENPNYTAVDYYRKYGYLRCSTKMLRMSLFNKIDENDTDTFDRNSVLAFNKVFPQVCNIFAYELAMCSRKYLLSSVRIDGKTKEQYPSSEVIEAVEDMDNNYMPYSQLIFDIVLKEIHERNKRRSR